MSSNEPKEATLHTQQAWKSVAFAPGDADFARATRGKIAEHPTGRIEGPGGFPIWDITRYDFLRAQSIPNSFDVPAPTDDFLRAQKIPNSFDASAPSDAAPFSVNPSLWRHAQLDAIHGLFEVAPGVWQARGYDISNITFIASNSGWIIIDPLTTEATARACLELVTTQLGYRPVIAVIYTHSHADHFGGVLGVTTQVEVDEGRCVVIAPEGFLRETVFENLIAGSAMARRSIYQFGPLIAPGPQGHVECGLGNALPLSVGSLIAPTRDITRTGEELIVDGVRIVFQITPETEAPAEMNFFFPDHGWLCMAENCAHTMHNLVPIRGTQVRDALAWSKYLDESIDLFAENTEVMFTSHHWPRWGRDDVRQFLSLQRDLYRWIHDQTMRFANHGLTPKEIAETLELPPVFSSETHTRGYYGHLAHNIKAVYQRYLSWYDGNPAHLHEHPPVEAGRRYVAFMGGAEELLKKARASFDDGDYRWVAEVVNHLVFAEPGNLAARELQADALEQLGYQTESATFRNAYLTGAQELRHGSPASRPMVRRGLLPAMTIELIFDALAVRLKSEEVANESVLINFTFTDIGEQWVLGLQHGVLRSRGGRHDPTAKATLTMTRKLLLDIVAEDQTFAGAIKESLVAFDGDATAINKIFDHLDTFGTSFHIIEP